MCPALSLIQYDPEIHPAMEWIFGQTFICKDMETAKKVTFHDRIMKKSVTLDGDVFDPSGTLSGGRCDYNYRKGLTRACNTFKVVSSITHMHTLSPCLDSHGIMM